MNEYHTKVIIQPNGILQLEALPFAAGELVEVTVRVPAKEADAPIIDIFGDHSLKGTVIRYQDPTEPVAVEDWEVLQ